jgi:hypothetical protein
VEEQKAEIAALKAARPEEQLKGKLREMKKAYDAVSAQSERQAAELAALTKSRNELADRVKTLSNSVELYESGGKKDGSGEVFEALTEIELPGIGTVVQDSGLTPTEKAHRIVEIVTRAIQKKGGEDQQIPFLTAIVSGLFRFLTTLPSRQNLTPLFGALETGVCKEFLSSQIQRLDSFMREHAIPLTDESTLFEEMLKKGDLTSVLDAIERFVPNCSEDHPLFIGLMQAVGANDILRKFSAEAAEKLAKTQRENRQLKKRLSRQQREREIHDRETAAEHDRALLSVVTSVRSILRDAVASGRTDFDPLIEGLRSLETVVPVDDPEYIQSLEQKVLALQTSLAQTEQSLVDLSAKKESILDEAQARVERIEERIADFQRTSESEKAKLISEKRDIEAQISIYSQEIASLKGINDDLRRENSASKQRLVEVDAIAKSSLAQLEKTFEATQVDCVRLVELKDRRIEELESDLARSRGKTVETQRRYRALLLAERNERNAIEIQLREQLSRTSRSLDAERLVQDVDRLTAESRSLSRRLAAKDEQHERDLALLRTQVNLEIANAETQALAKIEESSNKFKAQSQRFLAMVWKLFSAYIDLQGPLTFETAEGVLRKVREDLDAQQSLKRAKSLFEEIKQIVKAENDRDVVRDVTELVKFGEEAGQIRALRQKTNEFTGWIERIFALCGGVFWGRGDLSTMKRVIEQTIRSRTIERPPLGGNSEERKADLSVSGYAFD